MTKEIFLTQLAFPICFPIFGGMSKMQSINSDMDEIHDLNNDLYEHLVDDEDNLAIRTINVLMHKYKDLKNSLLSNKIN